MLSVFDHIEAYRKVKEKRAEKAAIAYRKSTEDKKRKAKKQK